MFVLAGPQLGAVFSLDSPSAIIGRDSSASVPLIDHTVSRLHATVTQGDDGVWIEDHDSRGGTFVNGERVVGVRPLRDGDRVQVGTSNILKFSMTDELEQKALMALSELALLDPLTRIYNRRYFDRRLQSELSFAARHDMYVAVLLIDVDKFKSINDARGHRMGDLVLRVVARTIERLMRPEDVLARLGGDEFVVIARATSLRNVEILGERICRRVAAAEVSVHGEVLRVTVSVGGALLETDTAAAPAEALVGCADQAMYAAKADGRNRVVVRQVAPSSAGIHGPANTNTSKSRLQSSHDTRTTR